MTTLYQQRLPIPAAEMKGESTLPLLYDIRKPAEASNSDLSENDGGNRSGNAPRKRSSSAQERVRRIFAAGKARPGTRVRPVRKAGRFRNPERGRVRSNAAKTALKAGRSGRPCECERAPTPEKGTEKRAPLPERLARSRPGVPNVGKIRRRRR